MKLNYTRSSTRSMMESMGIWLKPIQSCCLEYLRGNKLKNRIEGILSAIENDTVVEYRGRHDVGLKNCPICRGTKRLYIIRKNSLEIVFAKCRRCKEFVFNPLGIDVPNHNFFVEEKTAKRNHMPKVLNYEEWKEMIA